MLLASCLLTTWCRLESQLRDSSAQLSELQSKSAAADAECKSGLVQATPPVCVITRNATALWYWMFTALLAPCMHLCCTLQPVQTPCCTCMHPLHTPAATLYALPATPLLHPCTHPCYTPACTPKILCMQACLQCSPGIPWKSMHKSHLQPVQPYFPGAPQQLPPPTAGLPSFKSSFTPDHPLTMHTTPLLLVCMT